MNIKSKYKPELVASKDPTRIHMCEPWLDLEEKKVIATNGHMMLAVPVDVNNDDTAGTVPKEALTAARKLAGRGSPEVPIGLNGSVKLVNGATYPRAPLPQPVQWRAAMPARKKGDVGTATVALDVKLLATLAEAMGTKLVSLTIDLKDPLAPILVHTNDKNSDSDDMVAVLMPCRL